MLIAEVVHRSWVAQLVSAINDGLPAPHLRMDDVQHCRFGTWYYGHGKQRYATRQAYARIEPPLLRVHEIASSMDSLWREGRIAAARALIPELLATRDATLAALHELQLACGTTYLGD
jgi:hypothetical protein